MPITPKFTINTAVEREFTNREFFINAFLSALSSHKKDTHNIIVYYGIGGIGKTSLRKKLADIVKEQYKDVVSASIDFDLPVYLQEETALYYLCKSFKDGYKIHFPTFEISYAVYWQKTHPQTPMNKFNFPLIDESVVLGGLIAILGSIPIVGLIPGITKTVLKGKKYLKDWWIKRGQKELYNLPELEARDILNRLPMFFASDLKDFLNSVDKQCVIFIDSYQALWKHSQSETGYVQKDEWLKELIAHLPEPLWIICGREKLTWDESDSEWRKSMAQYNIDGLSNEDSSGLLHTYGIKNENLRKIIVESSRGVPYYLDLVVDTYYQIKQTCNREPTPDDFAKTQLEAIDRFLAYLDKTEIETLKVLSVVRMWNPDIFKMLINKFNTGYPATAMKELCRFSFINRNLNEDVYTMHELMRTGLQSKLDSKTISNIHKCLFEYFDNMLKDVDIKSLSSSHSDAISEAFFHCRNSESTQGLFKWFKERSLLFKQAERWKLIIPFLTEIAELTEKESGVDNAAYAELMNDLGEGYTWLGLYEKAISFTEQAVNISKKIYGPAHPYYAKSIHNLGRIYTYLGQYKNALPLFKKSLLIRKKYLGKNHNDYSESLHDIAVIYSYMCEYDKAIPFYNESLAINSQLLSKKHMKFLNIKLNLATVFVCKGLYDKAIKNFKEVMDTLLDVTGEQHPLYTTALNSLANAYEHIGQYETAIKMFEDDVEKRKNIYDIHHPAYAHSLSCLASVYYKSGHYEKAKDLFEESAKIRRETLGENHPLYAHNMNNLSLIYLDMGELDKALEYQKRALKIRKSTTGKHTLDHAASLSNYAVFLFKKGDLQESIKLQEEAIKIMLSITGDEHPNYAEVLNRLALVLKDTGETEKALELHEKANGIIRKSLGENSSPYAYSLIFLADIYKVTKKKIDIFDYYENALRIMKATLGEKHIDYFNSLVKLASIYSDAGELKKSLAYSEQALDVYSRLDSSVKPGLKEKCEQLNMILNKQSWIEK